MEQWTHTTYIDRSTTERVCMVSMRHIMGQSSSSPCTANRSRAECGRHAYHMPHGHGDRWAASHYGLMMPIAKATSHSFLPFPIGILAFSSSYVSSWFDSISIAVEAVLVLQIAHAGHNLCVSVSVLSSAQTPSQTLHLSTFTFFYRTSISKFLFTPMRSLPCCFILSPIAALRCAASPLSH